MQNQPGLDRGWAQESEQTPREAVWSGLWPQVSLSWKLPLVTNLNLALTRRAWGGINEGLGSARARWAQLNANRRASTGSPTGCLSASLKPIGMVHTQADLQVQLTQLQLTLEQTSVRWSPYVCLSPCLPALPTHLAPLRFLQAEAASVDLALRLWIDLDELIALGVPAGLGGL